VTETTYLWDVDGNGIEMTFETAWRGELTNDGEEYFGIDPQGRRHPGTGPLDIASVLAELEPEPDLALRLPPGTRVGHVHLHVRDLASSMQFYSGVLGFRPRMMVPKIGLGDVGLDYPPHIIAFNTWAGPRAEHPPEGTVGLRHF